MFNHQNDKQVTHTFTLWTQNIRQTIYTNTHSNLSITPTKQHD